MTLNKPASENFVRNIGIALFAITFLHVIPTYNKFWFPFDEGQILTWSSMILKGAVPYRDFFLFYGSLQLYILAFLFKIFGTRIEIAHLYVILIHTGVCLTIYYLTYKVSKSIVISVFIWLISTSCFATRIGAAAWISWTFVFLSLITLVVYAEFSKKPAFKTLVLLGFVSGLAFLARYELGAFQAVAIVFSLIVSGLLYKRTELNGVQFCIRRVLIYGASFLIVPAAFFAYLISQQAFGALMRCIFAPYTSSITEYSKGHFPYPCINPVQIFYGSLRFIQINQHYIAPLAYLTALILCAYLYRKKSADNVVLKTVSAFVFVGISLLPYSLYAGESVGHTMTIIYPALIVMGFILSEAWKVRAENSAISRFLKAGSILLIFLCSLLFIKNTDKYIKNTFVKPFKKDILLLRTTHGNVYVPKEDEVFLEELFDYLDKNTSAGEHIYVGFDSNTDVFQGGEPMIHFLSGRLPLARHTIAQPGVSNQESTQREIAGSLKTVSTIVLISSRDKIITPLTKEIPGSTYLDTYIRNNYSLVRKIGKYSIYKQNILPTG